MICTIALFIIILLYYSLKYGSTGLDKEGLNIVYDGVRHRIIRNKNNTYTCFDKKNIIDCTSNVKHLYKQTLDPIQNCWAQKINGKMMKVCNSRYPTRFMT